ncbi:MAG: hypothetical protein EBV03_04625 [Proteobacteria bacterium]|nr:hypothetical protein [Pseudomonadota bacterium]
MKPLSRDEVTKILELDSPNSIGSIIDTLTRAYKRAHHNFFNTPGDMPDFVRRAMGPPLENLPSYSRLSDKRTSAEDVSTRAQKGIDGLGEPLEISHSEMRLVGGKIGRLFSPVIRTVIDPGNLIGNRFNPDEVEKLRAVDTATVTFDKSSAPLTIKKPGLVYKAFMMGAEARSHLDRTEEEKKLLVNSVGTLARSYESLLDIQHDIYSAMRKDPDYKGKTLDDVGIAMNMSRIITAFTSRQKEFNEAYNYLYVVTEGNLDRRLQKFKWAIDGRQKPKAGIYVDTPKEAAATLAGLCRLLHAHLHNDGKQLCDTIARQTAIQAANSLDKSELLKEMGYVALRIDEPKASFAADMVQQLENFKEHYMGMDSLINRFQAPPQKRGRRGGS